MKKLHLDICNDIDRATESWYPWYPGDDMDQKFKDAEIKSSLLAL